MIRSADLSPCGRYRYALTRWWGDAPAQPGRVVFIGLNPSTADATVDDATVRKWVGFAMRWGYGGFTAVNLFAWRATDPTELAGAADPIGPVGEIALHAYCSAARLIVPCWGALTKLPPRLRSRPALVAAQLRRFGERIRCLGYTAGGDPRHPLMLSYATPLEAWPRPLR